MTSPTKAPIIKATFVKKQYWYKNIHFAMAKTCPNNVPNIAIRRVFKHVRSVTPEDVTTMVQAFVDGQLGIAMDRFSNAVGVFQNLVERELLAEESAAWNARVSICDQSYNRALAEMGRRLATVRNERTEPRALEDLAHLVLGKRIYFSKPQLKDRPRYSGKTLEPTKKDNNFVNVNRFTLQPQAILADVQPLVTSVRRANTDEDDQDSGGPSNAPVTGKVDKGKGKVSTGAKSNSI